jgi:4-amino-4-deoxy-L-arabinose transferase-like glycosyltransferase
MNTQTTSPDATSGSPTRAVFDRIAELPPWLLLSIAVAAFLALSIVAMWDDAIVNDEIAHLPAGYTYWTTGDFRLNPEHPPLAKLIAALPLRFLDLRWPDETHLQHWSIGQQWRFGYSFLFLSGNDADLALFCGRLPMLLWGVLLIVSVTAVARELFGPRGGLIALVLVTFCPEILAHSHLVNTDAPVAAAVFVAVAAVWKLTQRRTTGRAAAAGAAVAVALTVKYSSVMLIPALVWMILVAAYAEWEALEPAERTRARLRAETLRWAGSLAVLATVTFAGIWAVYGFRYAASPDPSYRWDWDFGLTRETVVARAVAFAREHRLLPEAYLYGFSYMHENAQSRNAFAFGLYSDVGWAWYFPAAFLVKTPVPILLLTVAGTARALWRSFRSRTKEAFLLIPLVIYWTMAVWSSMNIGVRHILPVVPLMIALAAGLAPRTSAAPWKLRALGGLLACTVAGAVAAAPYFLADFNLPSRLIWRRDEMLVDSSLDWGQDLGRLKKWMDEHGVAEIKLSYRGNASPRHYGLNHQQIRGSNMYSDYEREWTWARSLRPGDWVAISVTNLTGVLFEDTVYYRARFSHLKPVAHVGHSILIYRIPPNWSWKF